MNLKKILKSRRGVALENALLFMLVIFSLCALLTSLTLIGHFQTRINKLTLENEIALEQIGEDFLFVVASNSEFTETEYKNYVARPVSTINENTKAMAVWHKNDNEFSAAVLYVEAQVVAGKVEVLCWRYSLPENVH